MKASQPDQCPNNQSIELTHFTKFNFKLMIDQHITIDWSHILKKGKKISSLSPNSQENYPRSDLLPIKTSQQPRDKQVSSNFTILQHLSFHTKSFYYNWFCSIREKISSFYRPWRIFLNLLLLIKMRSKRLVQGKFNGLMGLKLEWHFW